MEMEWTDEPQTTLPLQPPPQPPLPPSQATRSELGEADYFVEQVGLLVASPPLTSSVSSFRVQGTEMEEEQRQAEDGEVSTVVVAEACMNSGANNEEPEHTQVGPKATPQTLVLLMPPTHSVDETEEQMVLVVEMNGFSEENGWKRSGIRTGHHTIGVMEEEGETKEQKLPAGLAVLIARSDPSGTSWIRVQDKDGWHGKEDLWK